MNFSINTLDINILNRKIKEYMERGTCNRDVYIFMSPGTINKLGSSLFSDIRVVNPNRYKIYSDPNMAFGDVELR